MRKALISIAIVLVIVTVSGATAFLLKPVVDENETIYQVSTLEALLEGRYDGITTVSDLKAHGDTGLGTFDGLDGEMILCGGICYQITSDGTVRVVEDEMGVPFACVSHMDVDMSFPVEQGMNISELCTYISGELPSTDTFYVIEIEGQFEEILTRSVPKQEKPYPPLEEVLKNQTIFSFNDVNGTIVGVWCPSYLGGMNAAGFHFHFLSEDGTMGGHVLDLHISLGEVHLDDTPELLLEMG